MTSVGKNIKKLLPLLLFILNFQYIKTQDTFFVFLRAQYTLGPRRKGLMSTDYSIARKKIREFLIKLSL